MEVKNAKIESFLKSFAFSLLLCSYVGYFAFIRTRTLLKDFDFFELLHLIHNLAIALLFLFRMKPSMVSMNPAHWTTALVTSFSGLFFFREDTNSNSILLYMADVTIFFAFLLNVIAALILGRSFGFLPALRKVKTKYLYRIVRHPMYLSSIINKVAYVLKNPSIINALLLVIVAILYDKRAKYEEDIMSHDSSYMEYLLKVKYRFVPGIY